MGATCRVSVPMKWIRSWPTSSKKYYTPNGDQDDLISIGTIGLIKGISTFKPDRNVRLATYASRCIENAILSMRLRKDEKEAGIIPRPLRRIGSVLYA